MSGGLFPEFHRLRSQAVPSGERSPRAHADRNKIRPADGSLSAFACGSWVWHYYGPCHLKMAYLDVGIEMLTLLQGESFISSIFPCVGALSCLCLCFRYVS